MHTGEFLKGKRALVTGAASGIGLAVARELGLAGADVIMSDIQEELLRDAAAGVPRARYIVADLACRDSLHALAREAGDVDILVNNAGLQHVRPIEDFEESKWDLLLATMLTAPFLLVRKLLPAMFANDWGRIINVGCVHSLVASPYKCAYVSAKHGLMGLTKSVALEAAARVDTGEMHAATLLATTALGVVESLQGCEYGLEVRVLCADALKRSGSPQAPLARQRAIDYAQSLLDGIRDPRNKRLFIKRPIVAALFDTTPIPHLPADLDATGAKESGTG